MGAHPAGIPLCEDVIEVRGHVQVNATLAGLSWDRLHRLCIQSSEFRVPPRRGRIAPLRRWLRLWHLRKMQQHVVSVSERTTSLSNQAEPGPVGPGTRAKQHAWGMAALNAMTSETNDCNVIAAHEALVTPSSNSVRCHGEHPWLMMHVKQARTTKQKERCSRGVRPLWPRAECPT